jgi:hypothetical protein
MENGDLITAFAHQETPSGLPTTGHAVHDGWATLKGEKANILFGWLYPCVYYTLG